MGEGWCREGLLIFALLTQLFHKNLVLLKQKKSVLATRAHNIGFFERSDFLRSFWFYNIWCIPTNLTSCSSLALISQVSISKMVLLNLAAWISSAHCGPESRSTVG